MSQKLPIRIVEAGATEAAVLAAMHREIFPEDPWSEEAFSTLLGNPVNRVWMAVAGTSFEEQPLGMLFATHLVDEWEIATLGVLPRWRRKCVAQSLLDFLCARVHLQSDKQIFLEVAADNEVALHFYGKYGFQLLSVRRGYYKRKNLRIDAHTMVFFNPEMRE